MSCAGKGYGSNPKSDNYLYSQFFSFIITTSVSPSSTRNCRKFKTTLPSFDPILTGLSVNTSALGVYSLVYVYGSNFLPNGTTFIKFGNYGFLPITYYSSFNISFVVPLDARPGNYPVQVVNLYNGNFSPEINQSYPGNINLSSSILYTIT